MERKSFRYGGYPNLRGELCFFTVACAISLWRTEACKAKTTKQFPSLLRFISLESFIVLANLWIYKAQRFFLEYH